VNNPPRYPLIRKKRIRYKRYTESDQSEESCPLKGLFPERKSGITRRTEKEGYSRKSDKEYGNNPPQDKPKERKRVENISLKKKYQHIIRMKKYHAYDRKTS
jgi:hypothetical protein